MKTKQVRARLYRLIRRWRAREAEFSKEANQVRNHPYELSQARYEGESIAFCWCCEDLEKLLEEIK